MSFKNFTIFLLIYFLLVFGCTHQKTNPPATNGVSWDAGFTLPDLLETPFDLKTAAQIKVLMDEPWHSPVEVDGTVNLSVTQLSTCQEYFDHKTSELSAKYAAENPVFLEFTKQCEAAKVLASAQGYSTSYIPQNILALDLVKLLPKELALIISESQKQEIMADDSISTWAEAVSVGYTPGFESDGVEYYFNDGGIQAIAVVGRGDFNGDGVEDVLISSTDSVEDGYYFNIRLFSLTVDSSGNWELIDEL